MTHPASASIVSPVAVTGASGRESVVRLVADRGEWDALFGRVAAPAIVQSWAYGDAKAASGWCVERLVFEHSGRPVAICQILVRRLLGLPLAARINRGPLFLAAVPDEAEVRGVYRALRRRWRFGRRGVLLLAPGVADAEAHRAWLRVEGFRPRGAAGWCSAVVDLRLRADVLRAQLLPSWRTHLNGAGRSSLVFEASTEPAVVEWMLARHREHMDDKGFAGTPPDFLRALQRAAPEDFIVCRALLDGQPLAGMIVFRFARSAEYFVGWFGPEARRKKAGNFLLWHAAVAMQAAGCERFDLGGYSSSDGYGRFKQGMRGSEYRLAGEWLAW